MIYISQIDIIAYTLHLLKICAYVLSFWTARHWVIKFIINNKKTAHINSKFSIRIFRILEKYTTFIHVWIGLKASRTLYLEHALCIIAYNAICDLRFLLLSVAVDVLVYSIHTPISHTHFQFATNCNSCCLNAILQIFMQNQ